MRTLSSALLTQLLSQESGDPLLTLITISHDDWSEPIRLVNNTEDVISNSVTFSKFSFRIGLPNDDVESLKQIQLSVDNTTLEFISLIRSVSTPFTVDVKYVLASIPDITQLEITGLKGRGTGYDMKSIQFTLIIDDIMNVALTSEEYSPSLYPGLF